MKRYSFNLVVLFAIITLLGLIHSCNGPQFGEISGIIQLEGQQDAEGTQIYLTGTQYRAIADHNGEFLITGIPRGTYTVLIGMENYSEYRSEVEVKPGLKVSLGAIVLSRKLVPSGGITGFITLEGEKTHEEILVFLAETPYFTKTNTTGYFELKNIPVGTYQFHAIKEGWIPAVENDVSVAEGKNIEIATRKLQSTKAFPTPTPEPPILGQFVLRGHAYLEGMETHLGIKIALESMPEKFTITSMDGSFLMTGLDQKPYTLVLSHPGFVDELIADAMPVDATSTQSAGIITLQREYDSEGQGVLQGRAYLNGQTSHGNITVKLLGLSPPVWTDEEGRYKFVGIPAGNYTLSAEHPGYQTTSQENVMVIVNQITQAPDIFLEQSGDLANQGTGNLIGVVELQGETDFGGITVAIEGTTLSTVTGPTGEFIIPSVPVGAYLVILTKAEYKTAYLEGVNISAGQDTDLGVFTLVKDIDPPVVIETFPSPGARRVPIVEFVDVMIRFSERMNGESVKRSVVIDPSVSFDAFFDRESELSDLDVLHLRLYQNAPAPVQFNTIYTVIVTPAAETPKGVPLAEEFAFNFTTGGPLIIWSSPDRRDSQLNLTFNPQLVFETNAPIDTRLFERSLRVRPNPDSKPLIQYIPTKIGTRVVIDVDFRPNSRYRVQIDNQLRTIDGIRFSNTPYSLSFQTIETERFPVPDESKDTANQPRRPDRRRGR